MKIALVSEHASPLATLGGVDAGGQNVHVSELAQALARAGNSVTVYTRRERTDVARRVMLAPGVTVEHVDAGPARVISKDALLPHMDAFAAYLGTAWQAHPPHVVHSHFWMSGKAALAAARPLGIPVVHTFHALGTEKRRHQGAADASPAERIATECAIACGVDRIVATASAEAFELLRMGAHPRAIKIIPCGVNLDHFNADGPIEPRRSRRFRVVTLSRLVARKGVADVIAALPAVPDAELIIAGGGDGTDVVSDPEAQRLTALAVRCGVANRVELRGRVGRDHVATLLRSADVVACTPWYEPFGIVPLEAMACGVPVVVSAVGGLIDTVIDGISGLHVPPRDPLALGRTLAALAADPKRRLALAAAGAARARSRYAWKSVAAETLEVYRVAASRIGSQRAVGEDVS